MTSTNLAVFAIAALVALGLRSPASANHIEGTGALAGAISAPTPFVAAKVFALNTTRKIRYMVFTSGGRYDFINLFPGHYEVTVEKNGFSADKEDIEVKPESHLSLNINLKSAPFVTHYIGARWLPDKKTGGDRKISTYEEIYPPGPGRAIIERTCMVCHGPNFLPSMPQNRDAWGAAVDFMATGHAFGDPDNGPMLSPDRLSPADRDVLLDYVAKNIGADKPQQVVKEESTAPLDEAVLGKAEYIEYQFPDRPNGFPHPENVKRTTQELTFDIYGNVWATETKKPGAMIRLDPRTGVYKDYPTPNPAWAPHGANPDNDGTIWWAGGGAWAAHLDPKTGNLDVYSPVSKSKDAGGLQFIFDGNGNGWWTDLEGNKIGVWNRKTNSIKYWTSPTKNGAPYGMVVDRKGKVWYSEYFGCNVVRFDPATEKFTVFPSPVKPCTSRRLGVDKADAIWFGLWEEGQIGRLDPATGKIKMYSIPVKWANPYDVWVDNADNVWTSSDNFLAKFDKKTNKFSYYPMMEQTDEPKITITRDDAIWFPPRGYASSGRTPASAMVLYPDKAKMKEFGAYFSKNDVNFQISKYKGPHQKVTGTGNNGGGAKAVKHGTDRSNDVGATAE